jgi:transcriptional antiterminator RfaH
MSPEPAWYCVHTKSKCEHVAAAAVRALGPDVDVYCPRIRFQRRTPRGKVWFVEALFPSYFFARFSLYDYLRAVNGTHQVLRVVQFGEGYIPMPDHAIDVLRIEMKGEDIRIVEPKLTVGDNVELTEGPMRGFTGIIDRLIEGKDRVRILLDFLGRQSFVEVDASSLLNDLSPRSVLVNG